MAVTTVDAAAALFGVAAFQVWQAWRDTAPSIADLREAKPGDAHLGQQLDDATMSVGTIVLGLGIAFVIVTHDPTALFLMAGILAALALWSYQILEAEQR